MKFSSNAIHVILLAGGLGTRFGGDRPKQFLELGGESLIQRSVRRFRDYGLTKSLVLVSHPDSIYLVEKDLSQSELLTDRDRIVEGGETRHKSTENGIRALEELGASVGDYVFFHDVARPFFLYSELDSLLQTARVRGAATLAVPTADTLVKTGGENHLVESSFSRDGVWQVKTPQIASWEVLEKLQASYSPQSKSPSHSSGDSQPLPNGKTQPNPQGARTYSRGDTWHYSSENPPTDLCTWCLGENQPIGIVPTGEWNMKLTRPGDRELAELYLSGLKTAYPGFE